MRANKIFAFTCCLLIAGCAGSEKKEVAKAAVMPPPQVTRAWLDEYEPRVRDAVKDSAFEFERRDNLLVVTAPVKGSFNPDRPQMLLPASLGPITRVAKLLEADNDIAVVILGHADSSGDASLNRDLSQQRARAVTSIFRLSGLKQNRLQVMGLGSDMPRAANDSAAGRALNRRVEILLTSRDTMQGLIAKYSQPAKADLKDGPKVAAADQGKLGKSE
ncbi:putative lipoprotein YiaD precursor [Pseudomonas sp. THAF187a]|uniref:OmpA/MotB domain protein n=2 Tax=Ectopseudomonas TaxID=3236654 RepID=A0A653B8Q4_ECTOL|nr:MULTISPECIES: OmpA family protein [unclassified Pseudomonas]TNF07773.1 MAG: OmpA family protein [Pseudomonadales bacterium]CAE6907561.1 OmpA/MotB domain protein [Pseudomonas oleovorans]QFT21363.1 putative lipoprotein YiaD precursor [Pseudomonas sp. THAF187a]QFT41551.1 putative lipoprotein YiaD precursor [Pseudomonas sp. THAF42]WFC61756.1 OmpA family protein [Pseudomonas sp. REST10]